MFWINLKKEKIFFLFCFLSLSYFYSQSKSDLIKELKTKDSLYQICKLENIKLNNKINELSNPIKLATDEKDSITTLILNYLNAVNLKEKAKYIINSEENYPGLQNYYSDYKPWNTKKEDVISYENIGKPVVHYKKSCSNH